MAIKQDKEVGCGISSILINKEDRFIEACKVHDALYEDRIQGKPTPSLKEVDGQFLDQMLSIAGKNPLLIAKAYIYWGLARVWGLTVRRSMWKDK